MADSLAFIIVIEYLDSMQSIKMQALNRKFYKVIVPRLVIQVPSLRIESCILVYHKKYQYSKIISVVIGSTTSKNSEFDGQAMLQEFTRRHPHFSYWFKAEDFPPWRCHDDVTKIVTVFKRREGMYLEEERARQLYLQS